MSEKSKLASDIQPFKPRWRLNWPFCWVGGGCSRAALSHAPVLAKSAPLAVSVRPHTPNCRASQQQHNTNDQVNTVKVLSVQIGAESLEA